MKYTLTFLMLIHVFLISAQETFTCANKGYDFLCRALGQWEVDTKDRTSPGVYETNTGKATIAPGIAGCSISISYRGTYKEKAYAREVSVVALDSINFQMVAMDSEHGSHSVLEGTVTDGQLVLHWFRNKEIGKLRSKYVMSFIGDDAFEFSSFLSTDYGESWALTHERKYYRE